MLWSVGDVKKVTVDGTQYDTRILGFNHDISNSITFDFAQVFLKSVPANSTSTNVGGYFNSNLASVASSYSTKVPMHGYMRYVSKKASAGNTSSTIVSGVVDLFFLAHSFQ